MSKLLFALLLTFSLFSCDSHKSSNPDLYAFVPEASSFIIESENLTDFLEKLESNTLFKNSKVIGNLDLSGIRNFSSIFPPSNSLVCIVEKDSLNYNYVILTKSINDSLLVKTQKDLSIESISTKDFSYKKVIIGNTTVYSTENGQILIASNSLGLLKKVIDNKGSDNLRSENFKKAIAARSKGKTSLFINHNPSTDKDKEISSSKTSFADWSLLDIDLSDNQLNYNGITLAKEQPKQILNIFQGIQHQKNEIAKITPASSSGFYSFTYNNFNAISKNLRLYNADSISISENNILNYTKEAGVLFIEQETAIALTLIDSQLATEAFPLIDEIKTEFRGIPIYSTSEINYLKSLEPLITIGTPKYYSIMDNFLIYSEKQETLEQIISAFQNDLTLEKTTSFEKVQEHLANASSLLIVTTPQISSIKRSNPLIVEKFSSIINLSKDYDLAATQLVSNGGFTHIHGIVLKEGDKNSTKSQSFETATHSLRITGKPHVLKNHNSKDLEIATQDENNVLSLQNLSGKVLWKKKLKSQILGEIAQVDLFKNGNLQMAFATLNRLHVLDRNGNAVKPFPLEFNDAITQALAIFDYDNRKNYRFVIVQKNDLLMFDSKGKGVKGFDLKRTASEIIQSPKHIRIKNKDYIVVPEKNGKLHALSRQGKERILVKEKIQFSESEWYENKNELVSISEEGKLVRIAQNGKVSKKNLTSGGDTRIAANEKILVLLSENNLKFNNKEITLDYGLYTEPKLYKVSSGTYISVTDTQAKKVYLFNEQGALVPNFPVYGISLVGLSNSKTKNKSIMLVQGENNEIISYEF